MNYRHTLTFDSPELQPHGFCLSELSCSRSDPPWERTKLQVPLWLVGAALVPGCWEARPRVEVLWTSCHGVRTGVCPGAYPGAWSSASFNLVVFLPATSRSKDEVFSPYMVISIWITESCFGGHLPPRLAMLSHVLFRSQPSWGLRVRVLSHFRHVQLFATRGIL